MGYGEGSNGAVVRSRDEYQKVWRLFSQNLVRGRGKGFLACAITKDLVCCFELGDILVFRQIHP